MEKTEKLHLYEIIIENRVVYRTSLLAKKIRSMKGRQGEWYSENFHILAKSKAAAERIAVEHVKSRRIMGRTGRAAAKYFSRQIQIVEIKEIGK